MPTMPSLEHYKWRVKFTMRDGSKNIYNYSSDKLISSTIGIEKIATEELLRMVDLSIRLKEWLRNNGGIEVFAEEKPS